MDNVQTPIESNDPIDHAIGVMAYMRSIIRSGDTFYEDEYKIVQDTMDALKTVRLNERITQLQLCANITEMYDFPTAHQKIVRLLEEARKERDANVR
jgi:hypothetical protein